MVRKTAAVAVVVDIAAFCAASMVSDETLLALTLATLVVFLCLLLMKKKYGRVGRGFSVEPAALREKISSTDRTQGLHLPRNGGEG